MKTIEIPVHLTTNSSEIKKSLENGWTDELKEYKIEIILDADAKERLAVALILLLVVIIREWEKKKKREASGNLLDRILDSTSPEELINLAKELGVQIEIHPQHKALSEREKLINSWKSYDFGGPDSSVPRIGSLKGKIWISPDFDEPLEDFKNYM